MMALLSYLAKLILCSAVLFGYYRIALRHKLFHQWNRFYLLLSVVLSILIPLAQITIQHAAENNKAIQLIQVVQSADSLMENVTIGGGKTFAWQTLLPVLYACISGLLLLLFIVSVQNIKNIIRKHVAQCIDGVKFIVSNTQGTPFSFLNYIFWNDAIELNSETGQQIFNHELVHVREKHTHDKMFMQLVLVLFWCNPFFWLIRKELSTIHEFIADQKAVAQHGSSALAKMILQAAYPSQFNALTNQFFHTSIKRRILMITKLQHPKISYISRIVALPLIALTVFAFTVKTKSILNNVPLTKEIVVVIDAGHGKINNNYSGAKAGELYEDAVVLAIAKQVQSLNSNSKIKIILTRTGDENTELKNRTALAAEKNADLFISLHTNALPDIAATKEAADTSKGFEVFVSSKGGKYQAQSELLGSALVQELRDIYSTKPYLLNSEKAIWVVDYTSQNICPSVLIRCGSITNAADKNFISSSENQKRIAAKILNAIQHFATAQASSLIKQSPKIQTQKDSTPLFPTSVLINGVNEGKVNNQKELEQVLTKHGISVNNPKQILRINIRKESPENSIEFSTTENTITIGSKTQQETKPLYIINGKESTEEEMKKLPAEALESVSVYKGEKAVELYGAKGKDGVINIQLKNIDTTKPKVIFQQTEEPAHFSGGKEQWKQFLMKNLNAAVPVDKGAPEGTYTVLFQFIVTEDGSVIDLKMLTHHGYGMEEEVTHLMQQSPKWVPAKQNGKVVASYVKQPVTFVIADDNKPVKKSDPVTQAKQATQQN